jgi:hypothetical protein
VIATEGEAHDGLPVLAAAPRAVAADRLRSFPAKSRGANLVAIPAVQAAAVAAGGFVAGAAFAGFVHRRQRRSPALSTGRRAARQLGRSARAGRSAQRAGELVQIVGSRSLLVDVHLLGGGDPDRSRQGR